MKKILLPFAVCVGVLAGCTAMKVSQVRKQESGKAEETMRKDEALRNEERIKNDAIKN